MSDESKFDVINPPELGAPRGYNNGMLAQSGRMLFVAGQVGWDKDMRTVSERFCEQFEQALSNIMTVVRTAGGDASNIGRLTIYVTDKQEYINEIKEVGAAYRRQLGKHFPAMALIEVRALLEPSVKVEIEATAVI